MRSPAVAKIAILLALSILAGCGHKPPVAVDKFKIERQKRDAWMAAGTYQAANRELQGKIDSAWEQFAAVPSCRLGIYSDSRQERLELDSELCRPNWHFYLRRNGAEEPWEFYLLAGRFYSQNRDQLEDHGPGSQAEGEKIYLPLLTNMRVAIHQAAAGEFKDAGDAVYDQAPVHRYDLRASQAGQPPTVITALVELDKSSGLLRHAIVGLGTGSASSEQRYTQEYWELSMTGVGSVKPLGLPMGVTVTALDQSNIDTTKPGLY